MSEFAALFREFGITGGMLVGAVYYILFRSVPIRVYNDSCTREAQLTEAVGKLTEKVGILIDRGMR